MTDPNSTYQRARKAAGLDVNHKHRTGVVGSGESRLTDAERVRFNLEYLRGRREGMRRSDDKVDAQIQRLEAKASEMGLDV